MYAAAAARGMPDLEFVSEVRRGVSSLTGSIPRGMYLCGPHLSALQLVHEAMAKWGKEIQAGWVEESTSIPFAPLLMVPFGRWQRG